jgi:hypothetical protein
LILGRKRCTTVFAGLVEVPKHMMIARERIEGHGFFAASAKIFFKECHSLRVIARSTEPDRQVEQDL